MDDELKIKAGQTITGLYKLVKLLGRGGMGSVWHADHLKLMSPIAIKVIKPRVARNHTSLQRFLQEAKAAALLRSPHVVQILDQGTDGDIAFITMELLEGESLYQRLSSGRLDGPTTAKVMTHVARALQRAHDSGIVHRDLKPDNIFLVENDDEILGKVLDFGIAKSTLNPLSTTDAPQTQTGALLGTPYYMSPEQATAKKDLDHRADLWAMGVIAYECLVGTRPFQSESLGDLVLMICTHDPPVPSASAQVPDGFDDWFKKAIQRKPADRFQSAKELAKALREVLVPSATPSVETTEPEPKSEKSESESEPKSEKPEPESESESEKPESESEPESEKPEPESESERGRLERQSTLERSQHEGQSTLDPTSITPASSERTQLFLGAAALLIIGLLAGALMMRSEPQVAPAATEPLGEPSGRASGPDTSPAPVAPIASATPALTATPTATATPSSTASATPSSTASATAASPTPPRATP
ncbi:serine/threonine protein kinase, partial [Endomicrobium sp. AH-315-J14]|nr:serine/threonine protein kinase [Endomicrobium sp. AH-315-J14]